MPWYLAGVSMVATTFAADTPLWVTEKIAQHGISGNWLWWNMLIGGMLTTFFFAKLWRRAEVSTELELIEFRYSGKAAQFLRAIKAGYMGLFINVVIIGWVNVALSKILVIYFGINDQEVVYYIFGIMCLVAIYSLLSGLKGVIITDVLQFVIAMTGCIVLAIVLLQHETVGGIAGLKKALPAWRFEFFPNIGGQEVSNVYSITIGAFLTFIMLQWYMSWYPGSEPGGGGYIAQRMMASKDEKNSMLATLFFQVVHYCIRPWPWIVTGLACLVLYPNLSQAESGEAFVMAMNDYLPVGLKGLLLVAFLGAYMSTISTHLNWGASYLTIDLYARFIRPKEKFDSDKKAQKEYTLVARLFTFLTMVIGAMVTTQIDSIDQAAKFLISCSAGLGLVLILRWYWWRINAWSEITATFMPFLTLPIVKYFVLVHYYPILDNVGVCTVLFNLSYRFPNINSADVDYVIFNFTALSTTLAWLLITFLTKAESKETLTNFYLKVKPAGFWRKGIGVDIYEKKNLIFNFLAWITAVVLAYSLLFFVGKLIFMEWQEALNYGICFVLATVCFVFSFKRLKF